MDETTKTQVPTETPQQTQPTETKQETMLNDKDLMDKTPDELDKMLKGDGDLPGKDGKTETVKADTEDKTAKELEELRKFREESQKFNGRLTNDLGAERKKNAEYERRLAELETKLKPKEPEKNYDVELFEKPKDTVNELIDRRLAEKLQAEQMETQRRFEEDVKIQQETYTTVVGVVPDFIKLAPTMERILLEDGVPPEQIKELAADIWKKPAYTLVQLAKRAQEREARELLEQRLKELPDKLNGAGKKPLPGSGQAPIPSANREFSDNELSEMSLKDLEELEKQHYKKK